MENRTRRDNLSISQIPEVITARYCHCLFSELAPEISPEPLEFDRIHGSLAPKPTEGPLRGVTIGFHYWVPLLLHQRERVLQARREHQDLYFQSNPLQLFADFSLVTIAKWRNIKPYLQVLQTQEIRSRWGFLFKLSFSHQGRQFHASSYQVSQRGSQALHSLTKHNAFRMCPQDDRAGLARLALST